MGNDNLTRLEDVAACGVELHGRCILKRQVITSQHGRLQLEASSLLWTFSNQTVMAAVVASWEM